MSLSGIQRVNPVASDGSSKKFAQAWCGNTAHDGNGNDGRECPWHVDGDLKSTNTIDGAYTVT